MKNIKHLLLMPAIILASFGWVIFALPGSAGAVDLTKKVCDEAPAPKPSTCSAPAEDPLTNKDKDGLIIRAVNIVVLVSGIAAVIGIIIGGFKYVLSNGDTNSLSSAKNTILYSVVGLAIAVLAQAIVQLVILRLI